MPSLLRSAPRALAALLALGAPLWWSCAPSAAAGPRGEAFDGARAWADLERIVAFGERPAGSPAAEALRRFLVAELEAVGLEPTVERFSADTPAGEIAFANVYADLPVLPPDGEAAPLVVLATHFDTKRLPFRFVGANDGGSGTAVLLELARCLAAGGPRPVAYRVLFLDGEESLRERWIGSDNRYGSRRHVARLVASGEIDRVRACVLLDMVGDRDLRLNRELYSDQDLLELFFEAAREIGLGRHVDGTAREIRDDHQSFLAVGVPSANLIDFSYGPSNDWWHSAEDTLDKCARESLEAVGRIVLAGLPRLEERVLSRELSAAGR